MTQPNTAEAPTADEWRKAAEELANVVAALLDEFADMARGSNNEEAARAALDGLSRLVTRTDATG